MRFRSDDVFVPFVVVSSVFWTAMLSGEQRNCEIKWRCPSLEVLADRVCDRVLYWSGRTVILALLSLNSRPMIDFRCSYRDGHGWPWTDMTVRCPPSTDSTGYIGVQCTVLEYKVGLIKQY